jgi:serine/threonine-protein kinase
VKACPACNSRYEDDVTFCSKDGTQVVTDKTAQKKEHEDAVGQVIADRYRLVKKLGEGGMGEVYVAEHVHIEKRVALKLLRPEVLSNQEAVTRFKQEARSASSIGHENIIEIDDFGTLPDGRVYLTMEYLAGAPLADMIEEPLPLDRALSILIQTCRGLAAAHAKGIVHRDMKPENIYVTQKDGRDIPKILDFGIAKVSHGDGKEHLTRTGAIFGTPFYMAPEQALGQPIDHRADIYAVGVIMYETFTGAVPFRADSFMGILTQHITAQPVPPSQQAMQHGRVVPPAIEHIILRAMAKNPADRFQSMNELAEAMTEVYRQIAGPGMTAAWAAAPVGQSQFVPVQTSYHQAAGSRSQPMALPMTPSTPFPAPITGGTYPPPAPATSAYAHPAAPPQIGTGTVPPPPGSSAYSAVIDAPKRKGPLIAILAVVGVALGVGAVSWYFLAGPGKKQEAVAAAGLDAGVTKPVTDPSTDPSPEPSPSPSPLASPTPPPKSIDAGTGVVVEPLEERVVTVLIDSVPRGATILIDGEGHGATPNTVEIPAGKETVVKLERRGYLDEELVIDGTETKVSKKLEKVKKGGGGGSGGNSGNNTGNTGNGNTGNDNTGNNTGNNGNQKPPDDSDELE